jgi:hypothetical protein
MTPVEQVLGTLDASDRLGPPPYPYYPYWNGQFAQRSPVAVLKSPPTDA